MAASVAIARISRYITTKVNTCSSFLLSSLALIENIKAGMLQINPRKLKCKHLKVKIIKIKLTSNKASFIWCAQHLSSYLGIFIYLPKNYIIIAKYHSFYFQCKISRRFIMKNEFIMNVML